MHIITQGRAKETTIAEFAGTYISYKTRGGMGMALVSDRKRKKGKGRPMMKKVVGVKTFFLVPPEKTRMQGRSPFYVEQFLGSRFWGPTEKKNPRP